MKELVQFWCYGDRLAGELHRPAVEPKGAVVLTGPLTSVKEQAAGAYAAALADRGWLALAFDHRGFGESGGGPRQLESPARKVEDLKAAVSFLGQLDGVERAVFAVGVCAGGGYMARAVAEDKRISAFAGVAGFYSDAAQVRQWMGERYDVQLARARAAREAYEATGEAELIPAVAEQGGDVAMPLAEAFEYYGTARGARPNYRNAFAVQSRLETPPFDAQGAASEITVPTLIVHSENALSPPLARAFYEKLGGPKRQLWLESKGQIDFYDAPALVAAAVSAADAMFSGRVIEPAG